MKRNEVLELCKENNVDVVKGEKTSELMLKLKEIGVLVVKRGRPVNKNSERQKRLKELEEKRKNGTLKKGRPINKNSERQLKLKKMEERIKNGEVIKKGRPVNENSERQKKLKEQAEKLEVKSKS